ncbi:MAG: glycoside hydrolase family 20 zincin-like fold domain-containing protein, partial [Armatimonadota bacterium]
MNELIVLCTLALISAPCVSALAAAADGPSLFPRPKEVKWLGGPFPIPAGATAIVIGAGATEPEQYAAEALQRYVNKRFGRKWPILRETADLNLYKLIVLLGQRSTCKMIDSLCRKWSIKLTDRSPGHDGYVIQFGNDSGREIAMVGGSVPRGVVYGQDTLFQLISEQNVRGTSAARQDGRNVYLDGEPRYLTFQPAAIRDWPSIPWRGRPHSDISLYDRPNTFDSFAQARVNFIDLRLGNRIYGTPPGFKLDVEKTKHVLNEAHRRGLFVFATVDCAVPEEQHGAVIKTYEEFISLGADGIYISIDDPGADFRMGTSIPLIKRIVELGKKHGVTGSKIAIVPGKESYLEIATETNYKVGHTPGMERALLFQTKPPSGENLRKTLACGFKIPPAWWLNWPRPRGGFTHDGNRSMRADRKQPYMDLSPLSEGWWNPSWESIANAGKQCSGVQPWGGSVWGNEYTCHVLNMWAWSPEQHDWTAHRRRIYDIVFGPDMVDAAMRFDDLHNALRRLFVMAPDYAGRDRADGLYSWPPVLRSIEDRPEALQLVAQLEETLKTLEKGSAKGSLLNDDQLV